MTDGRTDGPTVLSVPSWSCWCCPNFITKVKRDSGKRDEMNNTVTQADLRTRKRPHISVQYFVVFAGSARAHLVGRPAAAADRQSLVLLSNSLLRHKSSSSLAQTHTPQTHTHMRYLRLFIRTYVPLRYSFFFSFCFHFEMGPSG